ncbi:MAG TPA: AAA family ATPase [Noviherbaspirillum sp.]|nr:AAA family ATPase [Noviherbaspirillum sp.]
MARLHPSVLPSVRHNGGLFRELDALERLQKSLPDGYEIFHQVPMHTVRDGVDRYGEIDIVVMGPTGNVLLMEIKAGDVTVRDGELFKLYSNKEENVGRQCRIEYAAMVNRLTDAHLHPHLLSCLVLPDFALGDTHLVSIPRDRIIDATGYDFLGTRVREMLAHGRGCADVDRLRLFLGNTFRVTADLFVMGEQLRNTVRQLADGLASWVPRISAPSRCIRVQATAGSGKTQLAVRLLENAAASGEAALYVCYNRALADHMARIATTKATVLTFHEACVEHYRRRYGEPDFTQKDVFAKVTKAYLADMTACPGHYDVLIVDEGQDFEAAWLEGLVCHLKPDGSLYLLEDDDQRLYEREPFDLTGAVTITCRDNYRSPQAICQVINALRLASTPIDGRNPFGGELPEFHVYESDSDLMEATVRAISSLLKRGFKLSDISVLTCHGLSTSFLLQQPAIGPYAARHFTGKYNRAGDPIWSDGELLVESVYRYKGQSAPAVVLAEIDFAEWNDLERAKLFVGITRAQMAVEIVISEKAAQCLDARLV